MKFTSLEAFRHSIGIEDKYGHSLLHEACQNSKKLKPSFNLSPTLIKFLISDKFTNTHRYSLFISSTHQRRPKSDSICCLFFLFSYSQVNYQLGSNHIAGRFKRAIYLKFNVYVGYSCHHHGNLSICNFAFFLLLYRIN
jgi:hypothetical protein